MKPKESLEKRQAMAVMHESVLTRIDQALNNKRYIEACWLCYACFESRINRIFDKICDGCGKPEKTNTRHIGITTKLECCVRLIKRGYAPLSKEDYNLMFTIKGWCKERNTLIHGLVSLDIYNDADNKFRNLAKRGKGLVEKMYNVGKDVREYYYNAECIPSFDYDIICKCKLKNKCINKTEGNENG